MTPPAVPLLVPPAPTPASLRGSLPRGLMLSVLVHLVLIAAAVWWGRQEAEARPPIYRVNLIGAPPGKRQAGVVDATEKPAPVKNEVKGAERPPEATKAPLTATRSSTRQAPKATPNTTPRTRETGAKAAAPANTPASAPRAGSGTQGGKGADVANIRVDGEQFPNQGYLDNIVRQLTLNWSPRRRGQALSTDVKFTIRRDGTVVDIQIIKRSGDGIYDLDAMGAVEAVGAARGFGRLPSEWSDDVLIVYFTFDYALRS